MDKEQVMDLMENSQSEQEWNDNCNKVKAACNGYPPFWYQEIVLSGLASRVAARFGKDDKIHIVTIDREVL